MSKLLQKGDIFDLERGMRVYAKIPNKFKVSNRVISSEIGSNDFIVGDVLTVSNAEKEREINALIRSIKEAFRHHGIDATDMKIIELLKSFNIDTRDEEYDTSIFIGKYIVTYTEVIHNTRCGNSLKVVAEKIKNNKLDTNRIEIYFYQIIE